MDKQLQQLREFQERFACHIKKTPTAELPPGIGEVRARLIQEELDDYREALAAGGIIGYRRRVERFAVCSDGYLSVARVARQSRAAL